MDKLRAHFERMQHMAARYLEPIPYRGLGGVTGFQGDVRDKLFIQDMIEMLDGPEQREAQNEG